MNWYRWLYILFFVWEKPRYYQAGARMWSERITQKFWDEMYSQRAQYAARNREYKRNGDSFFFLDTSDGTTSDDFIKLMGKRPITPDSITNIRMCLFNDVFLIIAAFFLFILIITLIIHRK